jgi:hypothetical protein
MDEAPVAAPTETAPAPVETAAAPAEISTPAPDLLGSIDTTEGIQPDTSNEPWFNTLDEEYRNNPNVQKYGSVNEMAKGLINAQAVIGKKGIIKPGEDATPEEMGAYFNSLGRPTESSDYEYTPIEGAPDVDPDAMSAFQEFAHKNGFTQEAYQAGIEFDLERQNNAIAQFEQERADEVNQTRLSIYDEMGEVEGNAFIRDADAAGKALGLNDVFREHGIANNATVIRALANASKSLGSSSMVGGDQAVVTMDFDTQMADIRNNPAYSDKMHPDHKAIRSKANDLYARRYPS